MNMVSVCGVIFLARSAIGRKPLRTTMEMNEGTPERRADSEQETAMNMGEVLQSLNSAYDLKLAETEMQLAVNDKLLECMGNEGAKIERETSAAQRNNEQIRDEERSMEKKVDELIERVNEHCVEVEELQKKERDITAEKNEVEALMCDAQQAVHKDLEKLSIISEGARKHLASIPSALQIDCDGIIVLSIKIVQKINLFFALFVAFQRNSKKQVFWAYGILSEKKLQSSSFGG
ncbi:unnamed protein product [Gongylonema pulchrum]|uniref:Tropomyosin n=1 Tax=Gongylonema pulchrum TaxID=637853 RepID=A0A183ECF0_9BILA|nr:unnamed protein product [Gongylonema pulchrum]